MKISIITPSFQQGKFLEETIQSVLNQNYDDIEFIVIDGGSTDSSVSIIKKYEKSIDYWVSEKDSGQSEAINKGFEKATGDIITWINSDDFLLPGALQKVNDTFASLPNSVGLIYGGTLLFDEYGDKETVFGFEDSILERSLAGIAFPQPASFFRRSLLDKVGYLDESLRYGMDYDLFARLAMVSGFHFEKVVFSKYRLHNESKTVAEGTKFLEDWKKVFFRVLNEYELKGEIQYLIDSGLSKNLCHEKFSMPVSQKINLDQINVEDMVFYFVVRLIDNTYGASHYKLAKQQFQFFNKRFNIEKMAKQRGMSKSIWRLNNLPVEIIQMAKAVINIKRKLIK